MTQFQERASDAFYAMRSALARDDMSDAGRLVVSALFLLCLARAYSERGWLDKSLNALRSAELYLSDAHAVMGSTQAPTRRYRVRVIHNP
jgi:hypothetical protein